MLEFPEHYKSLADLDEKSRIRLQVEKSIVLWTYESETKEVNPDLHEVFHVPHGRTRRETVEFAVDTWDGDIIPFRQCLIRVARFVSTLSYLLNDSVLTRHGCSHFSEFEDNTCPISFTEEELKEHHRDGEGWNERADFWERLETFVHQDGWTSNERYEQAFEIFAQLREQGLQDLTGKERTQFEEQTRWAIRKTAE